MYAPQFYRLYLNMFIELSDEKEKEKRFNKFESIWSYTVTKYSYAYQTVNCKISDTRYVHIKHDIPFNEFMNHPKRISALRKCYELQNYNTTEFKMAKHKAHIRQRVHSIFIYKS